jgi:D-alanyl-D-alanine carboxypeptidase
VFSWRRVVGSRVRAVVLSIAATAVSAGLLTGGIEAAVAAPKGTVEGKYAAIVVDTATGRVLYESSPDARRYPASLTKMMTLYIMFEDLERGRFKLGSKLTVSKNASVQPPSKLGLRPGETITVEQAIKALVTKSANDAAAVIGENLAGSVPAFADRMTRTARALGMDHTRFRNASGLPDPGQYTTARDMMKLGVALQVRFPTYYEFFKTRSFVFRGRTHGNHNNLLGRVDGVDGIKTGYINASGFNLVSSVKRDGRKIVAVVMGGRTARQRDAHMVQLINAYLPKASRGRGYDEELVAEIRSAPRVAASAPHPEPAAVAEVAAPAGVPHPQPLPRPPVVTASVMPEIVTASVATAPRSETVALTRQVKTLTIPVPTSSPEPQPAEVVTASLPTSAAEAFADVAPLSSGEEDVLGAMIEETIGEGDAEVAMSAPVPVPAAEPAVIADVEPVALAAAPVPAPEPVAAAPAPVAPSPARALSGWMIQIGAVESEAAAAKLLQRAQSKAGKVLAAADPVTETVSKGNQTFVRARFAGFDSEKAASRACAALKKSDFACYTLRL